MAVPSAEVGVGRLVAGVHIGVPGRDQQVAGQLQLQFALDSRGVDVVHVPVEIEGTEESGAEFGRDAVGPQQSFHLSGVRGKSDVLRLDQLLDVVAEEVGGKAEGVRAVVETGLVGGRPLRLQVGVSDHLIVVRRVLEPEEELSQIGRAKSPSHGSAQTEVPGDPEQAAGARHEVAPVQVVTIETAPEGQYEPFVERDAIVDPEIDHVDPLAVIVPEDAVESPVLILGPLHSTLQQLVRPENVGDGAVQAVEALIEVGHRIDGSRLGQDVQNRALVVFSIEAPELPLGQGSQADIRREGVVLGRVVGDAVGGTRFAVVGSLVLVDEGVSRGPELEAFRELVAELPR